MKSRPTESSLRLTRTSQNTSMVAALSLAAVTLLSSVQCTQKPKESQQAANDFATQSLIPTPEKVPDNMHIKDKVVGTGPEAVLGKTVSVQYTGTTGGKEFDSSRHSGLPFTFKLGQGQVIPGWEKGIPGMKVGGIRLLTIPPELAYGARGHSNVIPPNATLEFEVELVKVE